MRNALSGANNAGKPWQTISAVRLQPAPEDGYTWSVTDSKAHLMKTSLSSGTVGLYDAICREIGRSIEAVRPSREADGVLDSDRLTQGGNSCRRTSVKGTHLPQ
ncbi:hypothetical protein AFUB_048420 [Aspergillus fumigatus A1163]|uniref:Uncharacterized protein n=1 Tax=Aspergillus fumigatus (strain CBS 144.89 / FGSC A1163 / CEA10) TaxID=451804 RepID=B0XXI2_ASPFC|nr:hypothetical protein AFUB_048420 [Aspergillus fumigatus A1163]